MRVKKEWLGLDDQTNYLQYFDYLEIWQFCVFLNETQTNHASSWKLRPPGIDPQSEKVEVIWMTNLCHSAQRLSKFSQSKGSFEKSQLHVIFRYLATL